MTLSHRQKLAIAVLALYWPALFVLAHIPIPRLVHNARVSDKTLHFLAYLILVFLLWFAISPDRKASWRRAAGWWVLLVLTVYGVVDELLQGYVGRNCDVRDLGANLAGILAGLILLSLFTFWPAALMVAGATIFGLTNITRTNLAKQLPTTMAMFHLFSYATFTLLWIRYMRYRPSLRVSRAKWLIVALALPTALLLIVKSFSIILGKELVVKDIVLSVVGIAAVVVIISLTALFRRTQSQAQDQKPQIKA